MRRRPRHRTASPDAFRPPGDLTARPVGRIDRLTTEIWQWRHRRRTGVRIDTTIHPDDEMYAFIRDVDRSTPVAHYLNSGRSMVDALVDALASVDRTLDPGEPFLEFACGHGRGTRHLVARIRRDRITVSDIHPGAVDFVTATYGVHGFVSVEDPGTLEHDGRYRTIFVASLFSHLSHDRWMPWVDAILALLEPDGVLVISTNGRQALDRLESRAHLDEVADGFWYGADNETMGRLDGAVYGTAYVDDSYVRRVIDARGTGRVLTWTPCALWSTQDLYVIERRTTTPATSRRP